MSDMIERAARAAEEAHDSTQMRSLFAGGGVCISNNFDAIARAALLAAIDAGDSALVTGIGEAYRDGMRDVLENIPAGHVGAINQAMQDAGARAVIAFLRSHAAQGENRPDRVQARRHPVVP